MGSFQVGLLIIVLLVIVLFMSLPHTRGSASVGYIPRSMDVHVHRITIWSALADMAPKYECWRYILILSSSLTSWPAF